MNSISRRGILKNSTAFLCVMLLSNANAKAWRFGKGTPTNTALPVILGRVATGEELVATYGIWTNRPNSFTFQWRADGSNVGTNDETYTLQVGDAGKSITVVVTAINSGGSTIVTSLAADSAAWTSHSIVTDLGCKTLTAIGSISGSTLTLTSNPGFLIGDQIIVEIGGESGAGVRGTVGVGGTWPATPFATQAALLATTPVNGTYAAALDTGKVWLYSTGAWVDLTTQNGFYYFNKINPRSLVTTITNVVGNVLTLNTAAAVSATNANVYFDNYPLLDAALEGGTFTGSYRKWSVPAGRYAVSQYILIARSNFILQGVTAASSVFFSPKGVMSVQIGPYGATKALVRDIGYTGNNHANGTGFLYPVSAAQRPDLTNGLQIGGSSVSCIGLRCAGIDTTRFNSTSLSTDCFVYDSTCVLTEPIYAYLQWQYDLSDSTGGGYVDCTFSSLYLTAAFETFRSTGSLLIRLSGQNGAYSVNSSGDWVLDTPSMTVTAGSQFNVESFSESNPMLNIDCIIQPPDPSVSKGGVVLNPSFVQQGRIDAGNTLSLVGILIGADNSNVSIIGTYPTCANPKGIVSSPDYASGSGLSGESSIGIITDATGTIVSGMRFTAQTNYPTFGNIHVEAGTAKITNCVMDHAATGGGSITAAGTITNATYQAGCP